MSPIENVVPTLEEGPPRQNGDIVEIRRKQDRTRDLFGIQLEVPNFIKKQQMKKSYIVIFISTSKQ